MRWIFDRENYLLYLRYILKTDIMKNTMKLFTLVALLFAAFTVSAQTTKPVKLGHINTGELMNLMPEMKKAQDSLAVKDAEIRKQLQEMEQQYQRLMQEYQNNMNTYTDLTRTAKEQEIQGLIERIQSFQQIAQQQMAQTQEQLLKPIMEKASKAIQEVGKENGFTYIFDLSTGAILYVAEDSIDVLPLVKKKLGLQ